MEPPSALGPTALDVLLIRVGGLVALAIRGPLTRMRHEHLPLLVVVRPCEIDIVVAHGQLSVLLDTHYGRLALYRSHVQIYLLVRWKHLRG